MGGLQPGFSSQMVSICAKSPDERLLPEWHDGSCEKFRCRIEHLQPTNGSDAPMGHLQPDAEILQASIGLSQAELDIFRGSDIEPLSSCVTERSE